MKRSYIFIGGFLIFVLIITIVGSNIVTGSVGIQVNKDILVLQSNKEVYFSPYGYSIDNPNVIVNPYGNSPLTAVIMFETDDYSEGDVCIVGKSERGNINYTFNKNKYHIIPIYGLYADYDNVVILRSEGREKKINIKTSELPSDFGDISYDGDYSFYNGNYPYASDSEGNVRWYLNNKYYGSISVYGDNIIIGNDHYLENGNSTGIYRMNLLGKVFGEYLIADGYYGYSGYYDGLIYVMSKNILVIDSQTGDVILEFDNDNYDYLGNDDEDIVVGRGDEYFVVDKDGVDLISYTPNNTYFFYDGVSDYRIIKGIRYGMLNETLRYDKDISIIKYDKGDLDNIDITMDVNRIEVINNNEEYVYLILDKLFDKRIYEIDEIKYINLRGLKGKYTIYYRMGNRVYKTDYFIEV